MERLEAYLAELKRMRAQDQQLLDQLNANRPDDVDWQERAKSLSELNIAAEVDRRVILALEELARTRRATSAIERFGQVLGWTGTGFAIITLTATAFFIWSANRLSQSDGIFFAGMGAVIALGFYLSGRALRYIFAGAHRR